MTIFIFYSCFESACTMDCQLLKFDDGNAGLTLTKCSKTITLDIFALAQFFVDSFSQSACAAATSPSTGEPAAHWSCIASAAAGTGSIQCAAMRRRSWSPASGMSRCAPWSARRSARAGASGPAPSGGAFSPISGHASSRCGRFSAACMRNYGGTDP